MSDTPAVPMPVRPFWKDPLFLVGLGYLIFSIAENVQTYVETKGCSWTAVGMGVLAGIVTVGRAAAPYVRTFLPFFDKNTPNPVGAGGGPQ